MEGQKQYKIRVEDRDKDNTVLREMQGWTINPAEAGGRVGKVPGTASWRWLPECTSVG